MSNAPTPITPVRAGSRPRRTTAPANWAKWKLIPRCTLWNAACLTLDIEPNTDGAGAWLTRKRPPDGFPAEFSDRLDVLTANFDADVFREVQIADVAVAAIGWGWSMPEAMKSLVVAVQVAPPATGLAAGQAPFTTISHSTKTRRDALTPVIEKAQSQCRNPKDTAEVWAALVVLAEKKAAPLFGATDDGLQYLKNGTAASFKRDALRKRLARLPPLSAANRR